MAKHTEVEVELVDGPADALADVAAMVEAVPGTRPRAAAKLSRALGERAPTDPVATPADGTAGELVRAYLAPHRENLVAADLGVRAGDDEAVHDARVATRRLRTALAVFRPVLPREVTDLLRAELRSLGHLLGEARDPVVELGALRRSLADEPDELVLGEVARRVEEDRSAARTSALQRVQERLDEDRTMRLLDSLDALVASPLTGPRAGDDADVLLRRVRKAWRRLDRALDAADEADAADESGTAGRDAALHEARKAARRARYAAEVLVPAVGKSARRSVRRARDVQDALGHQHDTVVRRATLRRLGIEAHLDGENAFTFGRLHALEQRAGEEAVRAAHRPIRRVRAARPQRWFEQ